MNNNPLAVFFGIFALLVILNPSAYAGGGTLIGNGGNSIVCDDGQVELLDLYELDFYTNRKPGLGDPQLPYRQKIDSVLTRLSVKSARRAAIYVRYWQELEKKMRFTDEALPRIPDSKHPITPVHCEVRQTAVQTEEALTIHRPTWSKLDNDNKAALLLHEIVVHELLDKGADLSYTGTGRIRWLVGILVSSDFEGREKEYRSTLYDLSLLIENHLISGDVYQGREPNIERRSSGRMYASCVKLANGFEWPLQGCNESIEIKIKDGKIVWLSSTAPFRADKFGLPFEVRQIEFDSTVHFTLPSQSTFEFSFDSRKIPCDEDSYELFPEDLDGDRHVNFGGRIRSCQLSRAQKFTSKYQGQIDRTGEQQPLKFSFEYTDLGNGKFREKRIEIKRAHLELIRFKGFGGFIGKSREDYEQELIEFTVLSDPMDYQNYGEFFVEGAYCQLSNGYGKYNLGLWMSRGFPRLAYADFQVPCRMNIEGSVRNVRSVQINQDGTFAQWTE